ncbi:HutD/Ves family protein [Pseudoclavibacter soli]|uniref:HutD/Ves family protein n=1 Tax=Pseudoclavibacter soli TaxID=452623 RepID=UPI0006862B69|nr:HutD family protein [Pseudoclavibacter soli]
MNASLVIRQQQLTTTPWLNGLGSTATVVQHPSHAAANAVDWRVSLATIVDAAPFSDFAAFDRWFATLAPAGLDLDVDGVRHELRAGQPIAFAGEAQVRAHPHGGAALNLNLMVRRDALGATLRELQLDAEAAPHEVAVAPGEMVVLVAVAGSVSIDAGERVTLHAHDALVVSDPAVAVRVLGPAHLLEARVTPVG